jgi:TolA-binding protein
VKEAALQLAMARRLLVEVSNDFEGTPSAATAQQLLREHFPEHVDHAEAKAAETQNKQASSKLYLAKKLLDDGKAANAKRWLSEIVKEFPGTEQAKEAASLLKLIP